MIQANSIKKYLQVLSRYNNYNNLYLRGQLEKYQTIQPTIARNETLKENENKIYNEALTMANNDFKGLNHPIEKLAKMQHYGIPTRLIDLTINPLIALFFAVQDSESESAGNVYIYLPKEFDMESKEAKALSLLAITEDYSFDNLCSIYRKEYNEDILPKELKMLITKPLFIKHNEKLRKSNERLYNQKGAFVICNNKIQNDFITRDIITLDAIAPNAVIRIPYEYKEIVKSELDSIYKINETIIYPEFTSVSNYLKTKYSKPNIMCDEKYNIIEEKEQSILCAKRISIIATLTDNINILQIKKLAFNIIKRYQQNYDVIWVFIAKNGDDYIMRNWIFRAQWISKKLDPKFRPLTLKQNENNEYYYQEADSYSTLSDYYAEHVFQDDKLLLVCHKKILDIIYPVFVDLSKAADANDLVTLKTLIDKYQKNINYYYFKINDFGHSRNASFDEYLYLFDYAINAMDNLHLWCENSKLNNYSLMSELKKSLKEAANNFSQIIKKYNHWENIFNVTIIDYNNATLDTIKKKEYQYTQTIPISETAINVNFVINVNVNKDNTFFINGKTNLFDNASLMLSIRDNNEKLHSQGKTIVTQGYFQFPQMSNMGNGYPSGVYKAEITLSLPCAQSNEFVEKAGIEYENLKGEYVNRTGTGPTVKYCYIFELK
jgi:FRG domain.